MDHPPSLRTPGIVVRCGGSAQQSLLALGRGEVLDCAVDYRARRILVMQALSGQVMVSGFSLEGRNLDRWRLTDLDVWCGFFKYQGSPAVVVKTEQNYQTLALLRGGRFRYGLSTPTLQELDEAINPTRRKRFIGYMKEAGWVPSSSVSQLLSGVVVSPDSRIEQALVNLEPLYWDKTAANPRESRVLFGKYEAPYYGLEASRIRRDGSATPLVSLSKAARTRFPGAWLYHDRIFLLGVGFFRDRACFSFSVKVPGEPVKYRLLIGKLGADGWVRVEPKEGLFARPL